MRRFLSASMVVGLALLFGPRMKAAAQITLEPGPQQGVPSGVAGEIAAGDFNGDGVADIAVNNRLKITVLLSNADGSLTSGITIIPRLTGITSLRGLTVGDLNNDQIQDLAVVAFSMGIVYRMTGRGDGAFDAPQPFDSGLRYARDLAIGELDGGNKGLDIAVAHSSFNAATVLLNSGSAGRYSLQPLEDPKGVRTFSLGRTPVAIKAKDLNRDGLDDLIAINTGGAGADDVSILLNDKGHGFKDATNYVVGVGASDLAVADLNGDGAPDIAVLDAGPASTTPGEYFVSILLNGLDEKGVGTGVFNTGVPITIDCPTLLGGIQTTCVPTSIAAGDFNGDGTTDIAVSISVKALPAAPAPPDGLLQVYTGRPDGTGTFDFAAQAHIAPGAGPIVAGDFTGHKIKDAITMDDIGINEVANDTVRVVRVMAPPPPATRTPTVTPTPLSGGDPCTSTSQCGPDLVCNDEGVCCTTATPCPSGQSCRTGGVCGVIPTPTATATPNCESNCQSPMRCDIFNHEGTCFAPLPEAATCEKTTDCELNLICNCGPNFICMVDTPQGFCDLPPTPAPTLPPVSGAQCAPGQISVGNGECADPSTSRSGGCSMGDRGANSGAWLFAVVPLALGLRGLSRRHARAYRRRPSRNQ